MLYFSKIKLFTIYTIIIFLSFFASINFFGQNNKSSLINKNINLGLDLQGGSYLLLEVDSNPIIDRNLQEKVLLPKKKN